jgi:hypothetical protein
MEEKFVNYRLESDSVGEKQVPMDAYYGVQTLRAFENFNITGRKQPAVRTENGRIFGRVFRSWDSFLISAIPLRMYALRIAPRRFLGDTFIIHDSQNLVKGMPENPSFFLFPTA